MIDLSVIIVNWNVSAMLARCLETLFAHATELILEVIVVDNASTDDSLTMLATRFPQVQRIANQENVGFAAANNQGLTASRGRYRLLLNPDTEVLDQALSRMVQYMDSHPQVGVLSPRLMLPDGTIQGGAAGYFPCPRTLFYYAFMLQVLFPRRVRALWLDEKSYRADEIAVDWVSGACLMLREEILAQVGGLDDSYFMYAEDIDWCYRIKQAGWQVICLSKLTIIHHIGGSTSQRSPGFVAQHIKGLDRYYRSKHPPLKVALMHFWGMWGFTIRALLYQLTGRARRAETYSDSAARTMWQLAHTSWQCLTGRYK
jgi:GT2 family glycosyltransferase